MEVERRRGRVRGRAGERRRVPSPPLPSYPLLASLSPRGPGIGATDVSIILLHQSLIEAIYATHYRVINHRVLAPEVSPPSSSSPGLVLLL